MSRESIQFLEDRAVYFREDGRIQWVVLRKDIVGAARTFYSEEYELRDFIAFTLSNGHSVEAYSDDLDGLMSVFLSWL